MRDMRQLGAPKSSRVHVVFAGVALAGFMTYAMVIPYMMIDNISGRGSTATVMVHKAGAGLSNSLSRRQLLKQPHLDDQQQQQQQQETLTWPQFWNSEHEEGLRTLQQLKNTLDMIRYQRLTKDVENQATAGLDIMLAEQLAQLSNVTKLQRTQAWLRTEVTNAVQQYLHVLQHPANCTRARKLLCDLNKGCGFGCEMHHVAHCLATAIALNRTMILKVFPSPYVTQPHGWEDQLLNVTSCTVDDLVNKQPPRTDPAQRVLLDDQLEVALAMIDGGASEYDPPALPQDVLEVVELFHARPGIWWTGILSAYIMRPSANSVQRQAAFRAAQGWNSPIVGVHVRRTDKLQLEAKLHQAEEYMRHVERYCDLKLSSGWQQRAIHKHNEHESEIKNGQEAGTSNTRYSECSVYLASDDTAAAYELREKYKHVHFIVNNMALKASDTTKRYTTDGLMGILDDITYLAETDFLVGTFSSQVSRLAYQINQANHTAFTADRAFLYHSVDSMWYYGGQRENQKCAAYDYTDMGSLSVPKGTQLSCPVIFEYDHGTGLMHCFITKDRRSVMLPPGAVVDCVPSLAGTDNHWYILPHYMRRPEPGLVRSQNVKPAGPASGGLAVAST